MEKVAHTPGPWRAEGWEGVVVNAADGSTLALMPGGHTSLAEVKANARLIASAPTMLEACKAVGEWFHAEVDRPMTAGELLRDGCPNDLAGVVDRLRAAIARAEGGAGE